MTESESRLRNEIERLKRQNALLCSAISDIDKTLRVPADEYLTNISDVLDIIDRIHVELKQD